MINKYLCIKRFKQTAIAGAVNIPSQSECIEMNNVIVWNNKAICFATSENGHTYFVYNTDGCGKQRAQIIDKIKLLLTYPIESDEGSMWWADKSNKQEITEETIKAAVDLWNNRWNAVWESSICKPFKRIEHKDHWLWNHQFYLASIETLTEILNLVNDIK